MKPAICIAALVAMGIACADSTAAAAAGDECVKILGYESSGEKQSMDPASLYSGDDAYHIFATHNRLVDLDEDFRPVPSSRNPGNRQPTAGPGRLSSPGLTHGCPVGF